MASANLLANTALFAAIVAGFGWVANKAFDIATKRLDYRRNRRAAIIRFYVDIRLRGRALAHLDDQDYLNAFRRRTEKLIRDSASQERPFRLYGVQVADTHSHDLIDNYLATFDFGDAELIREVVLLDRQMVAHYEKLESQAFEALDTERKIDAVDQWLGSAQALRQRLAALQSRMETWPELTSRRFAPDRIASKPTTGK